MTVADAYAEVERLTRREARNFAYGIRVLPREKRQALSAVYAFARRVDDVADGELPVEEKREKLHELCAALDAPPANAMFVALADARSRFAIPDEPLHDLVAGGLQDTEQDRYADFAELHGYCRRVAGAVGVACVAVYGSEDVERAETLGVALQLINIIRDVREDWELGRVYLPQDELAAYVVTEDDIAEGRAGPEWVATDGVPRLARARVHGRRARAARDAGLAQRRVRLDLRRALPGDARPDRGSRVRRLRGLAAPFAADEATHRRGRVAPVSDVACDVAVRPSRLCRLGRLRRWPAAPRSKGAR